jgi:outer membrane protein, heavy metal efflux system
VLICTCARAQEAIPLKQIVDEAVQRNVQLIAQRYDISIAEARVIQARLRPNPRVNVETNFMDWLGANYDAAEGPTGPSETNSAYVHTFETRGKRRLRTEAATGSVSVVRYAVLDATRTLILEVQSAYVDLLLAKENVRILRDILTTFDSLVRVNRTRFDSGEIARVELLRSEVAQLQFRNLLRQGELRVRQEAVRLQTLMGRPYPVPDFDAAGEMRRDPLAGTEEELRAAALAARPDLEALRRDVMRADAEARLQRAEAWPNIDAGLSHHKQYVGPFRGQTAGFRFEIPLPMYNRNQGEIRRADQERQQAVARIRALEVEIQGQMASAWQQ